MERLTIDRIYGTSSNNQLNVSLSTNLIAYIASGGVVVSKIDKENGVLTDQRFFCANTTPNSQNSEDRDQYGLSKSHNIIQHDDNIPQFNELSISPPKNQINSINSTPNSNNFNKIKNISCVTISPDEKLLAIGESGNQPRILIFSLAPDSNSSPIISIYEHNFGVLALKFSQDSKYLLSIGDSHDGFIYIWKVNGSNLDIVGVNKCTSQINGIHWIDDTIITFGIRHIKFWKFEQFERKTMIQGKNVILGDFLNSNFISACEFNGVNDDDFLFLTTLGEICGYNSSHNTLKLRYQKDESESYDKKGAILNDTDQIWIAGDTIKTLTHEELNNDIPKSTDGNIDSPSKFKFQPNITTLYKISQDFLIYITSNEEIQLFDIKTSTSTHLIDSLSKDVNGLKISYNGTIVNWTKNGVLKTISQTDLNLVDLVKLEIPEISNKVIENHITSLELTDKYIIIGDSYGNLSIYDRLNENKLAFNTPAHEYSINDVCYFQIEEIEFIVTIGRDRMIQVFARAEYDEEYAYEDISAEWSIFQTLADHKGNLLKLHRHQNKIYVSSADRTITVHKFSIIPGQVKIDKEKTISLKSTPSTFTIKDNDELVISSMDKQITVYNLSNFESTRSFKLFNENNDSLLIDNLVITENGILICSCSDKSVRVFNFINGKQLSVNWGHSDAIKSLTLINSNKIITLSNSGCLFSWRLTTENEYFLSNLSNTNGIKTYNDILTPKVTRKIKKPLNSGTPKRRSQLGSPSIPKANQPVNNATSTRLQSTTRLTPTTSKLSIKPNLSPSPSTVSSPLAFKTSKSITPVRSSSPTNSKFRSNTPILSKNRNVNTFNDENKVNISELILNLKHFKENLDSYTLEEVQSVKKEIKSVFNYEEELLHSYNTVILDAIKNLS